LWYAAEIKKGFVWLTRSACRELNEELVPEWRVKYLDYRVCAALSLSLIYSPFPFSISCFVRPHVERSFPEANMLLLLLLLPGTDGQEEDKSHPAGAGQIQRFSLPDQTQE
jgi:hypothetical protein